jgi:hypothetical protein
MRHIPVVVDFIPRGPVSLAPVVDLDILGAEFHLAIGQAELEVARGAVADLAPDSDDPHAGAGGNPEERDHPIVGRDRIHGPGEPCTHAKAAANHRLGVQPGTSHSVDYPAIGTGGNDPMPRIIVAVERG